MPVLGVVVLLLWAAYFVARYYESGAARDFMAEVCRLWRGMGIGARALAVLLVLTCVQWGGSKGVSPMTQLFRMLFWTPGNPWQLAGPASDAQQAEGSAAAASNTLEAVDAALSNEVATLSFDWHAPQRLPYHERQNVMGFVPWVSRTNIDEVLYEDHYVAFNAVASTNPAVILIEYARTLDDGTVERVSAQTVTNSFPETTVIELQSGAYTCYWFRCAVPEAYTNAVRDWNGEALFGSPAGSGRGFDLVGTLVVDDGGDVWVGSTTNAVLGGVTNVFENGINITGGTQ